MAENRMCRRGRGDHAPPGTGAPIRRSVRKLVVLPLLAGPLATKDRPVPAPVECIRVEVRNDQFLDVNVRPFINGIAVGERLFVRGLSTGRFTLRASTYLNAQVQFAIDPVGSSEVYFVPSQSTLSVPDTSAVVRIAIASRIWLSSVSLVDVEDAGFTCPP